jgi:hypothetical protein
MRMVMWKRFSYAFALVGVATIAAYAGPNVRTIQMRDDCDPASFNAAIGPGTCVGGGGTTFDEFLDALADGGDHHWKFNNDRTEADRAVNAQNRGGETHSFTEVNHFGGGFVALLNMGLEPVNECAARDGNGNLIPDGAGNFVPAAAAIATLVPAGGRTGNVALSRGTHRFQCCIHPWMVSTVTVR